VSLADFLGIAVLIVALPTLWYARQAVRLQRAANDPEIGLWMHSANFGEVVLFFVNRGNVTISALYLGIESGPLTIWSKRLTLERGDRTSEVLTIPPDDRLRFVALDGVTTSFELVAEFEAEGHAWRAYQDTSKIDKRPRLARVLG
jgi:hypothetical protein